MLLTHNAIYSYYPDIDKSHFPLPFFKVQSFYKYFGEAGGQLAFVVGVGNCDLSLLATAEGPVVRLAITYKIHLLLKMSNGIT